MNERIACLGLADGAGDQAAADSLMGHAPAANDMASIYRERISDERLQRVVDHVRGWLWDADASRTEFENSPS